MHACTYFLKGREYMQDFDENIIWQLFQKTGSPAFYSLYSRLKKDDRKDN